VELRRSALLICGDLREILFPGLLMQHSRCFTQIYADFSRRFTLIMFSVDLRRSALLICEDLREIFFWIADAAQPLFHADLRRFLPQIYADYVSGTPG
jgi:hypothetical protein